MRIRRERRRGGREIEVTVREKMGLKNLEQRGVGVEEEQEQHRQTSNPTCLLTFAAARRAKYLEG